MIITDISFANRYTGCHKTVDNLHQVRSISKDWKANNSKVFGSRKTKGPKEHSKKIGCGFSTNLH